MAICCRYVLHITDAFLSALDQELFQGYNKSKPVGGHYSGKPGEIQHWVHNSASTSHFGNCSTGVCSRRDHSENTTYTIKLSAAAPCHNCTLTAEIVLVRNTLRIEERERVPEHNRTTVSQRMLCVLRMPALCLC